MVDVEDKILYEFITDLQKSTLAKFRHGEKETQEHYERVMQLSMKLKGILDELSEETRQTIQEYIDEKDSLTSDELDYIYLQGIKDGCRLLKFLEII